MTTGLVLFRSSELTVLYRSLLWEEVLEDAHLTNADREDDDGLQEGPPEDPLVQILRPLPPLRLSQLVVGLVVRNRYQRLVHFLRWRLHLTKQIQFIHFRNNYITYQIDFIIASVQAELMSDFNSPTFVESVYQNIFKHQFRIGGPGGLPQHSWASLIHLNPRTRWLLDRLKVARVGSLVCRGQSEEPNQKVLIKLETFTQCLRNQTI